ncbi:hypothetical protein H4R24_003123 [Coemansia sp. RSA 988]|nr:hypothetical protein H4R24_003123 [Coemansia sp. RSA 988]
MSRIPVTQASGLLPKLALRASGQAQTGGGSLYIYETLLAGNYAAASTSAYEINLYEPFSTAPVRRLKYHTDQLTQIRVREDSVLSSSVDGQIAVWDIRQSANQPSLVLKSEDPILSFDISADKTTVIGGARLNSEYAAKILIWDMRMAGTLARVFEDSHSDDVTQIHCNQNFSNQILSGSTDGLLCTFDLSQPDEDEALQFVANTGASVAKCGYFGPNSQFIFAQSDMETLQLWTDEATRLADFGDVRELGQSDMAIDYIVKCEYDTETQRLYMIAGSNEGSLHIMHVGVESMEHIQTLNGGHSNIVRGFDWKLSEGCAISGCESGRIAWWSAEHQSQQPVSAFPTATAVSSSKRITSVNGRRFAPY